MGKKFYWIKLQRDFFKRHDIEIIESMPGGKDYVLFYLKLLVESVDHYGHLRFSDSIPYNDEMLAIVTRTNIDIVRTAIKVFCELGLMTVMDDKTLYMSELDKMVGSESDWADKKRQYREKREKKGQCPPDVPALSDKSIEKDKEIDKDKDKELEKEIEIELSYDFLYNSFPLFAKRFWKKAEEYSRNKIVIAQKAHAWLLEEVIEGKMSPRICSMISLEEFGQWAKLVMPYVNPDLQCQVDDVQVKLLYGEGT